METVERESYDAELKRETVSIRVYGTVQGVGFRPAVWRWARDEGLVGWTRNNESGLEIRLTGAPRSLERFRNRLDTDAPCLARIDSVACEVHPSIEEFADFQILGSECECGRNQTQIAPDVAICRHCIEETLNSSDRRFGYLFNNCIHCGPRWSIVRATPWDRERTSMAAFEMCPACALEFRDPGDRRFHAQPIACPECGPRIWLERFDMASRQATRIVESTEALGMAVERIREGALLAIQGVGGFHIACDATHEHAVALLRKRKHRYGKPFAMMARDLGVIARYATINPEDRRALESPEAPIVLLTRLVNQAPPLAASVAPETRRLGFMLPYSPLHLLILQGFDIPLVMTSGNRASDPQIIDPEDARDRLMGIVDYALIHNRAIENRIDDSVVIARRGKPRLVRRARGYVPAPIQMPDGFENAPEILAMGGELKSSSCWIRSNQALLAPSGGDLENLEAFDEFEGNLNTFTRLYDFSPRYLVVDTHPEYLSRKLGLERASADRISIIEAWHHHAHIASCMADNGLPLNTGPVFGIALDGLGFGDDETFWGGEVLFVTYDSYERVGGLKPVAMPGGSLAAVEPWRNAFAHLLDAIRWEEIQQRLSNELALKLFDGRPLATLRAMIERRLNAPLASSCGRLFDAVAALVGIHPDSIEYEAQAAVALETLAEAALRDWDVEDRGYAFVVTASDCGRRWLLDPRTMWQGVLRDLDNGVPRERIAMRFHQGLARGFVSMVEEIRGSLGDPEMEKTVVFSGGCCENGLLMSLFIEQFESLGYRCLEQARVPANDGGLALGQAAIGAAKVLKEERDRY